MRRGGLSKFIEEAVRWRVLEQTVSSVRACTSALSSGELQAVIDDAVAKVRTALRSPSKGSPTKRKSGTRSGRAKR